MKLILGDCLEKLKDLEDNSVDSIVTDPPYGLGKEPDALKMLTDWIETGHHDVKGRGFMGKEWDAFVPQPRVWHECLRVLKPGGHLLAFAGTRTQDLMTLGLRLAGFEIRDMVAWVYGSGFPKSLDVSKAIAKSAGAEREVIGNQPDRWTGKGSVLNFATDRPQVEIPITGAPATDAAKQWDGWGTALKPALEPITLARKPLEGTVAANVLKWHTGALNIDGCRVDGIVTTNPLVRNVGGFQSDGLANQANPPTSVISQGRWPANLIHDGSDEVLAGFPNTKSGAWKGVVNKPTEAKSKGVEGMRIREDRESDSGSAARFFYAAKCSKKDREGSTHPTMKPTDLMRYLCRLVTPPGGVILDPYMGSGSTGKAALREEFDFIGIERDPGYFQIARERIENAILGEFEI